MIKITFPDGSVREYNEGVTGLQIAESISSRLAQDVLACGVNGEVYDLGRPISEDAEVVLYKWEDEQGKHAFWHTSAHLLAEALQELYPGIQFGIGPAIENGFYYDVDPGETAIKEADLPAIEKKMAELAAKKEAVVRESISKTDALKMFGDRGETYKCGDFRTGRRSHHYLYAGCVYRLVPWSSPDDYRAYQGYQADFRCRCLLAGTGRPQDDDTYLRYHFPEEENAG